jgi:GTP-binding protein
MSLPVVAIVGRPNVGKSSLLNALCGRRVSIVEPTPGVTRDRVSVEMERGELRFELWDTGGIGIEDADDLTAEVERQIAIAMEMATLLLFVVDVRAGGTPLDEGVAERVRRAKKPHLLVANKADEPALDAHGADFYRLGLGSPLPVSARERRNLEDLLDRMEDILRQASGPVEARDEPLMKLAVVGRRNAGKSTLINALAGADRVITSEVPGTTRDAVDIRFSRGGRSFVAIDTAGLRKKKSVRSSVEFYSRVRAEESIRRCDVALLVIDATEKVGRVDKQIADYVVSHYRGCVVALNKWDRVPSDVGPDAYVRYLHETLPGLHFAPVTFLSAMTGLNVDGTLDLALEIFRQMLTRVSTAEVNRVIEEAQRVRRPPIRKGRQPKIFFAAQTEVNPPTVVLFANFPAFIKSDYRRYLQNRLREALPCSEVPIKLVFRMRS